MPQPLSSWLVHFCFPGLRPGTGSCCPLCSLISPQGLLPLLKPLPVSPRFLEKPHSPFLTWALLLGRLARTRPVPSSGSAVAERSRSQKFTVGTVRRELCSRGWRPHRWEKDVLPLTCVRCHTRAP